MEELVLKHFNSLSDNEYLSNYDIAEKLKLLLSDIKNKEMLDRIEKHIVNELDYYNEKLKGE